jgi:hypothetical protein
MKGIFRQSLFFQSAFVFLLFWTTAPLQAQGGDPWAHLAFLIGDWSGAGSGNPSDAIAGTTRFFMDLDGKILVRKNRAELAAGPGEKSDTVHEDLMIIFPQGGDFGLRADYFDNEGHVIHYSLSFPEKQPSAVFESDSSAAGPRFRLVYSLDPGLTNPQGPATLVNEFWIAPPGGEFRMYLRGELWKKN